jgi:hypothetical protein
MWVVLRRPWLWLCLTAFTLWAAFPGRLQAQSPAETIANLSVDLWPDYDRPEVLVLLTGTLSEDTSLPAILTVPLPAGATLNAVARISNENVMVDDIDYTVTENGVALITPDRRFRIEYYAPYEAVEGERRYRFTWEEDISVSTLALIIQQPAAATNLQTTPAAASTMTGQDGLTYHLLPEVAVPAGEPYEASLTYTADGNQLTADTLASSPPANPPLPTAPTADSGRNWPLALAVGGGALIVVALAWQLLSNRRVPAGRTKPKPRREATAPAPPAERPVRFCHHCGQAVQPGDRFCRNCGQALKGS